MKQVAENLVMERALIYSVASMLIAGNMEYHDPYIHNEQSEVGFRGV
jgi:hypothetical protein